MLNWCLCSWTALILTLSVNASMFQVHNCHSNAYIVPITFVLKYVIMFNYILQKPHKHVEIESGV